MRILLVKTSSLGDVIHNLPVVADIRRHWPQSTIDWCVEEGFVDIPRLHPGVSEAIPVAIRRWRRALLAGGTWGELARLRERLTAHPYDAIIDTQGLLKSALITRAAAGPRTGHSRESAREPLAARFYDTTHPVPRDLHAVERNRRLVRAALKFHPDGPSDYGIASPPMVADWLPAAPIAVLLTATSRADKLWPEEHWIALVRHLDGRGLRCVFPAGSQAERERAGRIAGAIPGAVSAPPLSIKDLAGLLAASRIAIGVDTGLIHLAAALGIPSVALYRASDPTLTGLLAATPTVNLGGPGRAPSATEAIAAVEALL